MNVLVVGGAGYIGSHVVLDLLTKGHSVTVFDNLSSGQRVNLFPEAHFVEGDIMFGNELDDTLGTGNFDAVIHLAALKAAGDSMVEPERYAEHNTSGTLRLIHAVCRHGVGAFVFSSSAAVYGNPVQLPIDEAHPLEPTNFYGFTKLETERFLKWYSQLRNLRFVSLRYFNAAGYDVEGRVRGLEVNPKNLIPIAMEVATGARGEMTVFGDDYDTPDGTCIRDYIHVNDLAVAHTKALEYMAAGKGDLICNLGTGKGFSVLEVLRATEDAIGEKLNYRIGPRRAGDPANLVAASDLAREKLDWEPHHSDLNTLIETAWSAYRPG
ncbi:UDP-glucose 4-epimerase GalE [Sulfidibacter corallicola]|uniref:UDP-glucose 4-epimerase n=1 Tax=Sulfidibacter corallicola TaxID=2818388 RepID=A0A8A4TWG9_SULCO|nr:UDP-glucose 4-epimerase GalE [Sulfidibacter corallicola]QTD53833.1 UDP-glucose 4-epimerase GalE [Sulfidibacter corallicola]